jgi:hypothetical protein
MAIGILHSSNVEDKPEITYEGCVLAKWEENGHDDSDFLAAVWDAENNRVTSLEYATTRGWTYKNFATVDATPDVIAKATDWLEDWTFRFNRDLDARKAEKIEIGKDVRVTRNIRTRQVGLVEKDSVGVALVRAVSHFAPYSGGYSKDQYRVKIRLSDNREVWIDEKDLVVDHPQDYFTPESELREQAKACRIKPNFATPFSKYTFMALVA